MKEDFIQHYIFTSHNLTHIHPPFTLLFAKFKPNWPTYTTLSQHFTSLVSFVSLFNSIHTNFSFLHNFTLFAIIYTTFIPILHSPFQYLRHIPTQFTQISPHLTPLFYTSFFHQSLPLILYYITFGSHFKPPLPPILHHTALVPNLHHSFHLILHYLSLIWSLFTPFRQLSHIYTKVCTEKKTKKQSQQKHTRFRDQQTNTWWKFLQRLYLII